MEGGFHTARLSGDQFVFTLTADSHLDQNTRILLCQQTLANVATPARMRWLATYKTFMPGIGGCCTVLGPYWHALQRRVYERSNLSLGDQHYRWLKNAPQTSQAKLKIILIHQLAAGADSKVVAVLKRYSLSIGEATTQTARRGCVVFGQVDLNPFMRFCPGAHQSQCSVPWPRSSLCEAGSRHERGRTSRTYLSGMPAA